MPQKINPIDFEHSEGMIEIANGLIEVLARELTESRLQRDLSDSPLFRFLGEIHSATLDAWRRTSRGLKNITPHEEKMREELWSDWAILAEPLQLILRQCGIENAYDIVRQKTQGGHFSDAQWRELITQLVAELGLKGSELGEKLTSLTLDVYIGEAVRLTEMGIKDLGIDD